MEAVIPMNKSGDYNHRKTTPVTNLYSFPSDDLSFLAAGHFTGSGLFSLSQSYPPAVLGFRPPHRHRQQPPLLPLPISVPVNHHNMKTNIYRSNSSSYSNSNSNNNSFNNIRLSNALNNKNVKNRGRDHSLTPKKSKNQKKNTKRDETIGADLNDLSKDVIPWVYTSSINNINNNNSSETVSVDKFSGSVVFTPSPPPSSLPLPTFSLRPKLGCNAQAAVVAASSGVDAGATDSLRRLLRL